MAGLLLLAGCVPNFYIPTYEDFSNRYVCSRALQPEPFTPKWGTDLKYSADRVTARQRGLTEEACAKLTGRFAEQQIAAANSPAPTQRRTNRQVCSAAIQAVRPNWVIILKNNIYEARNRGFTEEQCARISGRFTEQQIAAVHKNQTPIAPNSVLTSRTMSNQPLCKLAIQVASARWQFINRYRKEVEEAKRRGLTEQQCAQLAGRFSEQQVATANLRPNLSSPAKAKITEAQRLLVDLGYLSGRADGVVEPKTESAIKSFERAQHLLPTGTINDKLIVKLKEAQQAKLARAKSDKAKTLAQLLEQNRSQEARIKKQAEQLVVLRDQGPTKQPVRSNINFGNYHALVIGINSYRNLPRLRTAVADAEAIADVLESKYGFAVSSLINPTREQIFNKLDSLRANLTPSDNLLIYYAGHGVLDEDVDQGFWLPVGAKSKQRSQWISNATITDTLKAIKAKHVMVVADSCYSGRLVRGVQRGINITERADNSADYYTKMSRKKTRVVMTSGSLEPVEDGRGKHSPFAQAILNVLNDNDGIIDGSSLFNRIRRPVMLAADQTPQYSDVRRAGHDGGDFLFVSKQQTASLVSVPKAIAPAPIPVRPAVGVFTKRYKPGDTFKDCADCPEMVVIPAGSNLMGSPASEPARDGDEGPQHRVIISKPFAVGKYEVTQAEWLSVMGVNPSRFKGNRKPVEKVSWNDAQRFVKKFSAKTGKRYRLLSEAEWEYAARAGTTTPFHTGNRITTDQANFDGNHTYNGSAKGRYRRATVTVGSFPANVFGLHDMHGNVWEWVGDCWNKAYHGAPTDGGIWSVGDCSRRVLRGGSWSNEPRNARAAHRDWFTSGNRGSSSGFRIARTL